MSSTYFSGFFPASNELGSRGSAQIDVGRSALNIVLSNESQTLPADSSGNITSYAGANGVIQVYYGTVDVTSEFVFSLAPSGNTEGLTYSLIGPAYSVTGGFDSGESTATLVIRATGTGEYDTVILDKEFSLAKSIAGTGGTGPQGEDGVSPPLISLASTALVAKYSSNDIIVPGQTITFNAVRQNTTTATKWYVYNNAGTLLAQGTAASLISSFGAANVSTTDNDNFTLSALGVESFITSYGPKFVVEARIDGLPVADRVSIVKVTDGVSGLTWSPILGAGVIRTQKGFKKSSPTNAWDAQFYSLEKYSQGRISFTIGEGSIGEFIVGLNSDPQTDANYTSIDYGLDVSASGNALYAIESTNVIGITGVTWTIGDTFSIAHEGSNVLIYKGTQVIHTFTGVTTASAQFALDSSIFYSANDITNVSFTQSGQTGLTNYLTNQNFSVTTDSNGNVSSYSGAAGSLIVLSGSTDISSNFTLTTLSNPQGLTIGYVGQNYTVTGGLDPAEPYGSVIIRATGTGKYTGLVFDNIFTVGKNKQGASGPTLDISAPIGVFIFQDGVLTPSTQTIVVSALVNGAATSIDWVINDEFGNVIRTPASGSTASITQADLSSRESIIVKGTYQGAVARITLGRGHQVSSVYLNVLSDNYSNALDASNTLLDIEDGGTITKKEKKNRLVPLWTDVQSRYTKYLAEATTRGVSTTNFTNAYNTLSTYLTVSTSLLNTSVATYVNSVTLNANFQSYFTEEQNVITASNAAAATTSTWAGVTGSGKAEDFATRNNYYAQTADPGAVANGSMWRDNSTPPIFRLRVAGSWIDVSNLVTNTNQVADGAGLGLTANWSQVANNNGARPEDGSTRNNYYTGADPGAVANGSLWKDNANPPVFRLRNGGVWVDVSNLVTNTNQVADGAGLGLTATWTNVNGSGKPEDFADVTSIISGPIEIKIQAASDGTPLPGQLPTPEIAFTLIRNGINVSSSASWSVAVLAGVMTAYIVPGTGALTLSLNGGNFSSGSIRVTSVYLGTTRTYQIPVTRIDAAPTSTGGSGGGNSVTASITGGTVDSSSTPAVISAEAIVTVGSSGTVTLVGVYNFTATGNGLKAMDTQFQWWNGGGWDLIGSRTPSSDDYYYSAGFAGEPAEGPYPGAGSLDFVHSGLGGGSSQKYRVVGFTPAGTFPRYPYGSFTATGS